MLKSENLSSGLVLQGKTKKDWRPKTDMENAKEIADNLAFVKLALHRYYSVAKAAIRKYDKNT